MQLIQMLLKVLQREMRTNKMKDIKVSYHLLKNGIITLNEFLEDIGLEPIDHELADQIMHPKGYTTIAKNEEE